MNRIILSLVVFLLPIEVQAQLPYIDWWQFSDDDKLPDQSTWAAYYRQHARIRLEPEHRLPNGMAWRLHTDTVTGLAFPRITWMANARSQRAANRLLETGHGGSLLMVTSVEEWIGEINGSRAEFGLKEPLTLRELMHQTDVALTYASSRLLSVVDLGDIATLGSSSARIIRGLTFDLATGKIHRLGACPGSSAPYGPADGFGGGNFQFQFGELLRVCDQRSYASFVALLQAHGEQAARAAAHSTDPQVTYCINQYIGEHNHISENVPLVLYLTFGGLAVMNTTFWPNVANENCAFTRSAINPVIIPHAELRPS
ncbi:MAG TPA: hypothetical protein VFB13_13915 [Reyranella sp.]|jgi:hypothetical protein|nr:hypothetical protein [Reyranella sp.]